MKKIADKNIIILYGILVCMIAVMLFYIGLSDNTRVINKRATDGYTVITDYQYYLKEDPDAPLGCTREYSWTLDELKQGDVSLVFYVVHHYVKVYLDDELVYSVLPKEKPYMVKSIGCTWVTLPLETEDIGKKVRVELTPVYGSVRNRKFDFMIGSYEQIYQKQLKSDLPQLIVCLIAFMIGMAFLVFSFMDFILAQKGKRTLDSSFSFLGLFSMLMGLWKMTDTRFASLVTAQNPILLSYLSLIALMLIGVPFIMTVKLQFQNRRYRFLDAICLLNTIMNIGIVGIQLSGVVDLRETLWITHVWLFVFAGAIIAALICWNVDNRGRKHSRIPEGLFALCAVGIVADMISFYVKGNSSGIIFTLSAFLAYVIFIGVIRIVGYMEQEKKLKEQEAELAASRISIMLSQIQPHFLYNSLNSIYHLCAKDPEKARKAISDFSDYLRANLDSLTRTALVSFDQELKHVKTYLSLEKMRFDEELEIIYEIDTKMFLIPALTVQPLVENAVKHGVGKKPGGGTVKIATKESKDYYEVIISDDGIGYDTDINTCFDTNVGKIDMNATDGKGGKNSKENKDNKTSHIGIENVRNRLKQMCDATLEIVSEKGKGTEAHIYIPKE